MPITERLRRSRISLSLKLSIGTAAVLGIAMAFSYVFMTKNLEALIMKHTLNQARSLFKQIVLTEKWISDHMGLYVGSQTNMNRPLLREGAHNNPASIIRELSSSTENAKLYWFRTTSLQLKNIENSPDDFEREALLMFERGSSREVSGMEKIGSTYFFRYAAPLYVEPSCLICHSDQGYQIGDVRGALSLGIPMDFAFSMLQTARRNIMLVMTVVIFTLMLILYWMMKKLVITPIRLLGNHIGEFSVTHNTNIPLIETGDEIESLSRSFTTMSESLNRYHSHLKDMVHAATKELEHANEKLIELNERKSDFVAKVSHELRTPLTSIKGAMEYLSAKFSMYPEIDVDTDELIAFFNVIKSNAERLVRMVNDTLDLERIESGAFDIHFSNFDILNLIKDVITGFQSITSKKRITFRLVGEADMEILADEDRIRQVMINLISNAVKASPHDAEIEISVLSRNREVSVSVSDKGPGISLDHQDKIFDKFFTASTKDGSGLGLAICKGIIEAHHGTIISDKDQSRGCTMRFTLPQTEREM